MFTLRDVFKVLHSFRKERESVQENTFLKIWSDIYKDSGHEIYYPSQVKKQTIEGRPLPRVITAKIHTEKGFRMLCNSIRKNYLEEFQEYGCMWEKLSNMLKEDAGFSEDIKKSILDSANNGQGKFKMARFIAIMFVLGNFNSGAGKKGLAFQESLEYMHLEDESSFEHKEYIYPRILTEKAPLPPEEYYGREKEWEDILNLLRENRKIILVNGLGGVGKSTICKKIYHYFLKQTDIPLVWISYNGKRLVDDFIAQMYYPASLEERKNKITQFIQTEIDKDAIIFVDNLNSTEMEDNYIRTLAGANCRVICTSRIVSFKNYKTVTIDFMDEEDAVNLFLKYYTREDDRVLIKKIVNKAARHTLVIEVLGKIAMAEAMNLKTLLEELEKRGFDLDGVAEVDLTEKTLIGHLCKLFSVRTLNGQRRYILGNMAILSEQPVPREFLQWINVKNMHNVRYLINHAWFADNDKTFYMHPIIRDVVRRLCPIDYEESRYLIQNITKLTDYRPNWDIKKVLFYLPFIEEICKTYNSVIDFDLAALYYNLSIIYWEIKNYRKAMQYIDKCWSIRWNPFIYHDQGERGSTLNQKATIYFSCKQYEKAARVYEYALDIRRQNPDKRYIAQSISNISLCYQKLYEGDSENKNMDVYLEKALGLQHEGIQIFEEIFKKINYQHANLASAYNNLGGFYKIKGDYRRALIYYYKACKIRRKVLPSAHRDMEVSYNNMGEIFFELYQKSEKESHKKRFIEYSIQFYKFSVEILEENRKNGIVLKNAQENKDKMKYLEGQLLLF